MRLHIEDIIETLAPLKELIKIKDEMFILYCVLGMLFQNLFSYFERKRHEALNAICILHVSIHTS